MKGKNFILMLLLACCIASCDQLFPSALEDDQLLDGPVEGLSYDQNRQFLLGDAAFNNEVFTDKTGLGSIFVATSCGTCHAGDGKDIHSLRSPASDKTDETGNKFLKQGGPQLQHRALPGFTPEVIPAGATFSKFTPPGNTGLGFLELVSDADILAMADPDDLNGDGISGVPNWSTAPYYVIMGSDAIEKDGKYIGRFGKKAATHNLLQQTVTAYNQDIGITSGFEPYDVYSGMEMDPEISAQTVNNVVFYLQTLKAPIQRSPDDQQIINGKNLFVQIGCENCHKQTLKTSFSSISPLSNKEFHPYTDLLLHDMGAVLDDGYTEGSAKTYEWRTPPLWGLGLSVNSQGGNYFLLHDGRAHSIEEAIVMHGGEAISSNQNFSRLSSDEKESVIQFLKSL